MSDYKDAVNVFFTNCHLSEPAHILFSKNSNIKIYIIFCMINIYLHISVIKLLNYYLKNTPVSASII